ncbi:hypothetical protein ERJ75_000739100 [Trypanosoma vivax]|uniref:Uncharacterized protein n=1 Tax=Trypanosoma vivax (strain Y486) TaxID=1055687 RepID=G0TXF2_TRYVY|nr:hypothetical protein TRVL_07010 [Trypanosoma vivax]KAH8613820.1 hypothetical protein ERJ75_000739100 [Trypanosoma vivax]CCC48642.1 conserved hypothetical protein [Trypanosoma vivax Y486]
MEQPRRKEEVPLWLNDDVHAWKTKNDLFVVNLRDTSEPLQVFNVRPCEGALKGDNEGNTSIEAGKGCHSKASELTKQESLNALLALMHQRPEQQKSATGDEATVENASLSDNATSSSEQHKSQLFQENGAPTTMKMEFVDGVSFPGSRKVVPPPQAQQHWSDVNTVALFHDPVWGEAITPNEGSVPGRQSESNYAGSFPGVKLHSTKEVTKENSSSSPSDVTPSTSSPAVTSAASVPSPPTTAHAPPSFKASASGKKMVSSNPVQPAAMASFSKQIAYPQGVTFGMPMQPLHIVSVPVQFMPQPTVMAVPQPYQMPCQFYQVPPQVQARPLAPPPHRPLVFRPTRTTEALHMTHQAPEVLQAEMPRPGTNVRAAPFFPGGKVP